jgi:hypothetical protein
VANTTKLFIIPKRTYTEAFSFISSSLTHSTPVPTMDPIPPHPTTPDRRFARTKHIITPNKLAGTFAPSSQPVGSTQRALQASLTGNVVFANEAIVDAIFQPSKVDDQTVVDILAEMNVDTDLKAARGSVLSGKLAETKKYNALVRNRMLTFLCGL